MNLVQNTESKTPLLFLAGMFTETMNLLLDAQHYFSQIGPKEMREVSPVEKLVYSSEMSRVTLRLSSVMAWLLVRRAEANGHLPKEGADVDFRLNFRDICLHEMPEMHHVLPEMMCELIQRSLELYRRAARLDGMTETAKTAAVH